MIVFSVLVLGVKTAAIYTVVATVFFVGIVQDSAHLGHTVGRFQDADALLASLTLQILVIQVCFFLLMVAYDVIRNRAEVRAVLLRMTDDEAARLATRGERMGTIAQELQDELGQFRSQLQQLDGLAKRSDTKVEDVQTVMRELQEKTHKLSEISRRAHG
jgi:methyl-accepting chemotaxis protein